MAKAKACGLCGRRHRSEAARAKCQRRELDERAQDAGAAPPIGRALAAPPVVADPSGVYVRVPSLPPEVAGELRALGDTFGALVRALAPVLARVERARRRR